MPALTIKNIPDELLNRLKKRAADNHRSVNSEVIVCLEGVLNTRRFDPEKHIARIEKLHEHLSLTSLTDEMLKRAKEEGRP